LVFGVFYLLASALIRIDASPGGHRTNSVEDSVLLFEFPSIVFGVAGSDAFAVSEVLAADVTEWLSAALAFCEVGGEDDPDSLHEFPVWSFVLFDMILFHCF
jgi:hypothetical protein